MENEIIEISSDDEQAEAGGGIRSGIGIVRINRRNRATVNFPTQFEYVSRGRRSIPNITKHLKNVEFGAEVQKNEGSCCICLEEWSPRSDCTQLPCNHIFCRSCITIWIKEKSNCPKCRFVVR